MNGPRDTILVVDGDSGTRAMLREQIFASEVYRVIEASDGPSALVALMQHTPDLILLALELEGLSGRDMIVAAKAQGYAGPLIVMGDQHNPRAVTEALRLGATDYLPTPLREAEALSAIDRGLAAIRLRRQRDSLVQQLEDMNTQLEARLNELTTLYEIGQTVAALRDLDGVFAGVLEGALTLTGADQSYLLLRDDHTGALVLQAGKNLQPSLRDHVGESVSDPLADIVIRAQNILLLSGEQLHKKHQALHDLYAVAYVPLMVHENAIGVLAVGNYDKQQAFKVYHGQLLRSLADYAAIAIVSARLFRLLNQRARAIESANKAFRERDVQRSQQFYTLLAQIYDPLVDVEAELLRMAQTNTQEPGKTSIQPYTQAARQVRQVITQVYALLQHHRQRTRNG